MLRIRKAAVVIALGLALFLPGASKAWADSDGYYCLGPDYLAYEFLFSDGGQGHRLFILKLGDNGPDTAVSVLEIDDFQVHDMRCFAEAVELVGWEQATIVALSPARQPVALDTVPVEPCGEACPEVPNLGLLVFAHHTQEVPFTSKPLVLVSENPCGYLLNAARQTDSVEGGLRHNIAVDLVWRCQDSTARGARRLFQGSQIEPID